MTPGKIRGGQKPPESKAEDGPFTSSNPHIQQTTLSLAAVRAASMDEALSAAHIAAGMGSMSGGSRALWMQYQVPASETKEGIERERAYYEALGRFVQIFAEAEKLVWQTLVHYANSPKEKRDDPAMFSVSGGRLVVHLNLLQVVFHHRDAVRSQAVVRSIAHMPIDDTAKCKDAEAPAPFLAVQNAVRRSSRSASPRRRPQSAARLPAKASATLPLSASDLRLGAVDADRPDARAMDVALALLFRGVAFVR
jgi:hypothetical protein